MSQKAWVVGAGGLLGSAVVRVLLSADVQVLDAPAVAWGGPAASSDLAAGLAALVDASAGAEWQIFWCAGAGVTDTGAEALESEQRTFGAFLEAIRSLPQEDRDRGTIVLASSAGAVYGGSAHPPFDEHTVPVPLGAYGVAKLQAEEALRALSDDSGLPVVVARIANVYGPGQNLAKQQGLVSRLCLSAVTRSALSVFVSLDTLRDYVYVDDCAKRLIACARRAALREDDVRCHLKIVGSGQATSIAALLGHFRHIRGPRPLVVMGTSPAAALQSRDLRLLSTYWTDLDAGPSTTLAAGIDRTMDDLWSWLQSGRLAPAPPR